MDFPGTGFMSSSLLFLGGSDSKVTPFTLLDDAINNSATILLVTIFENGNQEKFLLNTSISFQPIRPTLRMSFSLDYWKD